MARNLELRSTFQFSGENIGTLSTFKAPSPSSFHNSIGSTIERKEVIQASNFGVATMMSKVVFASMDNEMREMAESYSSKKMASVVNRDFQDNMSLSNSKEDLERFEFVSDNPFETGVNAKFCLRNGSHKGHMILHIPAFVPVKRMNVPEDATNFKICATLVAVSDFDRRLDSVELVNEFQHGSKGYYETTMLPVLKIPTQPITAQLSIPNVGSIGAGVSTVLIIGVKFYSYKNSKFSFMPKNGMMKIMRVR